MEYPPVFNRTCFFKGSIFPLLCQFSNVYCWWLKSGDHQLRLVVYPIIYRILPSTVWPWTNDSDATVVPWQMGVSPKGPLPFSKLSTSTETWIHRDQFPPVGHQKMVVIVILPRYDGKWVRMQKQSTFLLIIPFWCAGWHFHMWRAGYRSDGFLSLSLTDPHGKQQVNGRPLRPPADFFGPKLQNVNDQHDRVTWQRWREREKWSTRT